jgi:hypothetical protein
MKTGFWWGATWPKPGRNMSAGFIGRAGAIDAYKSGLLSEARKHPRTVYRYREAGAQRGTIASTKVRHGNGLGSQKEPNDDDDVDDDDDDRVSRRTEPIFYRQRVVRRKVRDSEDDYAVRNIRKRKQSGCVWDVRQKSRLLLTEGGAEQQGESVGSTW